MGKPGHLPSLGLSLDAGVDCHGYRPLSLVQLVDRIRVLQQSKPKDDVEEEFES